jgi:hypothetical protein
MLDDGMTERDTLKSHFDVVARLSDCSTKMETFNNQNQQ